MRSLFVAVLLASASFSPLPAADVPAASTVPVAFALSPAEVSKTVVLVNKPSAIQIEVTYSKEKQEELAKLTADGLPKKVRISLSGQVTCDKTFDKPASGHSIKLPMLVLSDALSRAAGLMQFTPPGEQPAEKAAAQPAGPVLALSPEDIKKFAVFAFKPKKIWVEVTIGPLAHSTAMDLASKNPGAKLVVTINHKYAGEWDMAASKSPTDIHLPFDTYAEAITVARAAAGGMQ